MRSIIDPREMTAVSDELRANGRVIALVPTMGYFHRGHLSLFQVAKANADLLVVSIFVNPIQFGPAEDYRGYPRNVDGDRAMAQNAGVDYLFCPEADVMYPSGYSTYVEVTALQHLLCGAFRPHHFKGVATICLKLFNIVKPHVVVFGQKDAQQAVIIRRMIQDLNLDLEMIVAPTVREPDGLAASSRNEYLTSEEREEAVVLHKALEHARRLIESGERRYETVRGEIVALIQEKPLAELEYAEIVEADTLKKVDPLRGDILIAVACRFGKARLIDNIALKI